MKWETRHIEPCAFPTAAIAWKIGLSVLYWRAIRIHSLPEGEVDPISSSDTSRKKWKAHLSSALANEEIHVLSGVSGERPIRDVLVLLPSTCPRSGAGSRAREELPESMRAENSHSRPADVHLEHLGRVSSHLILLRLSTCQYERAELQQMPQTYRQVLHPSLVGLEVTTRFLPMFLFTPLRMYCAMLMIRPARTIRYLFRPVAKHGEAISAHTCGTCPV